MVRLSSIRIPLRQSLISSWTIYHERRWLEESGQWLENVEPNLVWLVASQYYKKTIFHEGSFFNTSAFDESNHLQIVAFFVSWVASRATISLDDSSDLSWRNKKLEFLSKKFGWRWKNSFCEATRCCLDKVLHSWYKKHWGMIQEVLRDDTKTYLIIRNNSCFE